MATFKDRAQIGIDRGIPVIRVAARAKNAYDKDWQNLATTDPEVIAKWDAETPAANCAFVAKAEIGGVWMLETDSIAPSQKYEAATGKKFTKTFTVQSREGRGHRYYRHNESSIAMGNIGQKEADGFSVRAKNAYCLGPLSVHPTGAVYMTKLDGPIVEAEPEMIAWLVSQKKASAVSSAPSIAGPKIPLGGHDNYLTALALKLRLIGAEEEGIFYVLNEVVEKRCEGYGADYQQMTRKHARNTCAKFPAGDPTGGVLVGGKSIGQSQVEVNEPEPLKLASIEDLEVVGMPESVIPEDSVLGRIFYDKLANLFPIDFGWVSLIHAAGVLVPVTPRGTVVTSNDDLTNFYTALVGPTNCGKTTAWTHARLALGIHEETHNYINLKSGSAETLFENIQKGQHSGSFTDQLFIDVDELSHLFSKIGIEGASFAPVLTTGFYKKLQTMFMGKGKNISLNCAMSWIGGIVTEQFEECFGSATIGGLYDRFMFGLCPTGYTLAYEDFRCKPATVNPIPVTIDPSVYEIIKSWRKDHPELTREIELAVRFAKVIASFDQRPVLYGKDMEGAPLVFAMEQSRIRKTLKPNAGDNPDARFANAIMSLLARKTKPGEWMDMRTVKLHLNVFRENLGPNVMERAINGLLRAGDIEFNSDKTRKNGKSFIRLAVEE
jgi:hypothetical protein